MAKSTSNPADTMPIKIQLCFTASILTHTHLNLKTSIGLSENSHLIHWWSMFARIQ